jgi:DNA replication protein DnaC
VKPPVDVDIDGLLKRLSLANTRRCWRELVIRAEKDEWSCRDFLAVLVAEEVAQRQQTRVQRLSRRAGFPFLKTVDDFNFTFQTTVKLSLLGSALSPDFVTDGRNLVLHGPPGRGKTHLAVAVAYRAIQNGFDARFVTAAELIDELSGAFRAGRLADALSKYVGPHVLVVDEVGYLTYGTDAANMLYHVVNDRPIFRGVRRGGRPPSASAPPARISGISSAEFPEPTTVVKCGCSPAASTRNGTSSNVARSIRRELKTPTA